MYNPPSMMTSISSLRLNRSEYPSAGDVDRKDPHEAPWQRQRKRKRPCNQRSCECEAMRDQDLPSRERDDLTCEDDIDHPKDQAGR